MSAAVSTRAHARHAPAPCAVGDAEARMRMRRAQHHGVQRAVRHIIGDIAAAAANEGVVFLARDRFAEAEFHRLASGCLIPPAAALPPPACAGSSCPQASGVTT